MFKNFVSQEHDELVASYKRQVEEADNEFQKKLIQISEKEKELMIIQNKTEAAMETFNIQMEASEKILKK